MKSLRLSRRTVLRGLLGGAAVGVGLPLLEAMLNANGTALADGASLPRRFILWYWGNGMLPETWTPAGAGLGDAWELTPQLAALAPVKHRLSLITGTEVRYPNRIPHFSGSSGLLTGRAPVGEEGDWTVAGPSLDQVLAQEMGGATRFRSLELGARPGSGFSWNGPNSMNPPEGSPHAFFERIFGAGFTAPGEEPIIDPTIALRRSVLDVVMEQTATLRTRVGTADKARLDQHLSGVRDLELRLARMEEDPPNLAACERPDEPLADELYANVLESGRISAALAAMALSCDQTRVLSFVHTPPVDNYVYPGISDGHHQLTHNEVEPQEEVHGIVEQIMGELAHFLGGLEAVVEGEGTLLDNAVVLATSEVSYARTHSLLDFPILLAGTACGHFKQDQHYRSTTGENASRVIVSVLRSMGMSTATWGTDDAFSDSPLSEIER